MGKSKKKYGDRRLGRRKGRKRYVACALQMEYCGYSSISGVVAILLWV